MALEDGSDAAIARAIKQIITGCTFEKVDVKGLATFDLEYIFLLVVNLVHLIYREIPLRYKQSDLRYS